MKYFLDWGRSKQVAVLDGDGKENLVIPKELSFEHSSEIYLESGFSSRILYTLLDSGCRVFRIHATRANGQRTEEKGSDMEDAHFLRELYMTHPESFIEIERPSEDDIQLRRLYTMYKQVTRDIVRLSNIKASLNWEHGLEGYEKALESLKQSKKEIFSQMRPFISDDLKRFRAKSGIKGVGPMLLAQILSIAHPKNFPSLSKYLAYCGCKASTFWKTFQNGEGKGRGSHSWDAKTIGFLLAESVLMKQDPHLKAWYYDIKERFHEEHPEWPNGRCHGKAMNRLRTFVMKEIYYSLTDNENHCVINASTNQR